MNAPSDWIWYGSSLVLAALALSLAAWALFSDRSRDRLRCPGCWYSMHGIVPTPDERGGQSWQCPECGRRTRREKRMRRTRRRWRLVTVAVFLLLGAAPFAVAPRARSRGWLWPLPTRVLVESIPLTGDESFVTDELSRRLGAAPWPNGALEPTLSARDHLMLLRRIRSGSVLARPTGARWKKSFGAYFRRERSSIDGTGGFSRNVGTEPPREEFERACRDMREFPYEITFQVLPPSGSATMALIRTDILEWWPQCTPELRVHYRSPDASIIGEIETSGAFALPVPGGPNPTMECEIDVLRRTYYEPAERSLTLMGTERRTFILHAPTDPETLLEPVRSGDLDEYIRAALLITLRSPPEVTTLITPSTIADRIVFGGTVEVFRGSALVAQCDVHLTGGMRAPDWPDPTIGEWVYLTDQQELQAALRRSPGSSEWSARFTSHAAVAIREPDARRYWVGQVDLRLLQE